MKSKKREQEIEVEIEKQQQQKDMEYFCFCMHVRIPDSRTKTSQQQQQQKQKTTCRLSNPYESLLIITFVFHPSHSYPTRYPSFKSSHMCASASSILANSNYSSILSNHFVLVNIISTKKKR